MQNTTSINSSSDMPKVLSVGYNLNNNLLRKPSFNDEDNGEINNNNGEKKKRKGSSRLNSLRSELTIDEHRITLNELCERFSTNLETVITSNYF